MSNLFREFDTPADDEVEYQDPVLPSKIVLPPLKVPDEVVKPERKDSTPIIEQLTEPQMPNTGLRKDISGRSVGTLINSLFPTAAAFTNQEEQMDNFD